MRRFLVMVSIVLTGTLITSGAPAKTPPKPFNRLVVMVDGSGSYAGRQSSAIEKVGVLLRQMAETKVRRWEAGDEISILSLDAIPDVIWRGNLKQLRQEETTRWAERFKARRDYAGCTDVVAAFRLTGREFARAPEPTGRYLMAFTDLQDEPPTSSPSVCKPVTRPGPPAGFPWDSLRGVSVTVFWVPIQQKLAWQRVIADQGGDLQVALYSESESGSVDVVAPPKARRVVTEEERAERREQVKERAAAVAGSVFRFGVYLMVGLVALGVGSRVLGRFLLRSRPWER